MKRRLLGLLALCLMATPAAAQQQPQPQPNQAQPQPQPNQAQPQPDVQRTTNGAWIVECVQDPQRGRLCQMVQNVSDPNSNKALMQLVVAKPPGADAALLTVVAPLGVWLRPGVSFAIDGGTPVQLGFEVCLKAGCVARMQLAAGMVNSLKRGSAANLSLQNIRRQKLDLTASLSGFTKSFDSL